MFLGGFNTCLRHVCLSALLFVILQWQRSCSICDTLSIPLQQWMLQPKVCCNAKERRMCVLYVVINYFVIITVPLIVFLEMVIMTAVVCFCNIILSHIDMIGIIFTSFLKFCCMVFIKLIYSVFSFHIAVCPLHILIHYLSLLSFFVNYITANVQINIRHVTFVTEQKTSYPRKLH